MKKVSTWSLTLTLSILVMVGTAYGESPVLNPPVVSGTNVSLSWQPVESASGYTLYYAPIPYEGEHTIANIAMGTRTEFAAELWAGAAFKVAVTAQTDSGESEFSNISQFTIAGAATVYDDFSGTLIDESKWIGSWWSGQLEQVREISDGKFISRVSGKTNEYGLLLNQLGFAEPNDINSISAKVSYLDGVIDETYTWNIGAQIEGFFYEEAGGSVWAGITLEYRDSNLFISCGVNSSTGFIGGDTFMLPIQADQEYTLKIEYDGNNQFTFWANEESRTVVGPERTGASNFEFKALTTGVWGNGGSETGSGYISATFDDVVVNGTPYDDFADTSLDSTKWWDNEIVRELRDGQLQMNVQNFGNERTTSDIYLQADQVTDYFQADVTVQSESVLQGESIYGQARIWGSYYNDTYSSGYNGSEGLICGRVLLKVYADGSIKPKASIFRCNDADCDSSTDILDQEFNCTVQPDIPVPLAIEQKGSTLVFYCGEEHIEHQMVGTMYEPENPSRMLRSRIYSENSGEYGYLKTRFDNVYVSKQP